MSNTRKLRHADTVRVTGRAWRMLADFETRVQTDIALARALARGTDPGTPAGREAAQALAKLTRIRDALGRGDEDGQR